MHTVAVILRAPSEKVFSFRLRRVVPVLFLSVICGRTRFWLPCLLLRLRGFGGIVVGGVFHINPLVLVMAAAAAATAAANMPARFFCGGDIVGYFYNLACLFIHNVCSAVIIIFHTIYSTK